MKLQEYFYPTINFVGYDGKKEYPKTDYAEIEIVPNEDDYNILENLERYASRAMFTEDELEELDNPNSDGYEHVIAYVHFDAGTYNFNRMYVAVITAYSSDELELNKVITEEEKLDIINKAKESLEKWRNTNEVINEDM